jgi:nucleoside-diphosphate-sugar epimerase
MEVINEYEGSIVLVTGGAGCIGTNLCRKLAELGAEKVVILDDLSSAYEWNIPRADNISFVHGSILDDEMLKRVFKEKPNYVFHLAAHFANQNSVDNPETGCGVYGLDSKMPFEEHDISISLHTPYQVTKLVGELYTNYFHNLYGLPIVNARFFNVFGPGEVPGRYRNVIPNFFYWAMNKQALPITGDGTETRDWTYVDDIIDGLLAMGIKEEAVGEAINLGSGEEHRVIDLANMVNEFAGNEAGISYVERRDWDVKHRLLSSIEKAKRLLGYEPQTGFEDGLKKVHAWFVENWADIERSAEF